MTLHDCLGVETAKGRSPQGGSHPATWWTSQLAGSHPLLAPHDLVDEQTCNMAK